MIIYPEVLGRCSNIQGCHYIVSVEGASDKFNGSPATRSREKGSQFIVLSESLGVED